MTSPEDPSQEPTSSRAHSNSPWACWTRVEAAGRPTAGPFVGLLSLPCLLENSFLRPSCQVPCLENLSPPNTPSKHEPFFPSSLLYLPQQPNSKWSAPVMHACASSTPRGLQEACRLGGSGAALGMEGGQPERRKGDALGFHFSLHKAGGKAGALPGPLKTRKVWASRGSSKLFL